VLTFKWLHSLPLQFGAILTLIIFALDPFAQQLVQFEDSIVFEDTRSSNSDKDIPYADQALTSIAKFYAMGSTMVTQSTAEDSDLANYTIEAELPVSMQSAILNGLSRSPSEIEKEALVQCPTGNCTWDPFDTVGVCHKCNDITDDLRREEGFGKILIALGGTQFDGKTIPSTAYVLPNGHFIANIDGCPPYNGESVWAECDDEQPLITYSDRRSTATTFGTGNPKKTNTMKDVNTLIWSTSIIYPDVGWANKSSSVLGDMPDDDSDDVIKWPEVEMKAQECALYYCMKTVRASVEGNQLTEDIQENKTVTLTDYSWERGDERPDAIPENIPPNDEKDSLEFHKYYSVVDYSDLTFNTTDVWSAYISQDSVKSISAYFQTLFKGQVTGPNYRKHLEDKLGKDAVGINGATYGPYDPETFAMESTPPAITNMWSWRKNNMTRVFHGLAASMTNEMRRNYDPEYVSNSEEDGERIQTALGTQWGKAGRSTVVYRIQWPWITLHGFMLLTGATFFCATLISDAGSRSRYDVPLWKSSSLATIRRGFEVGHLLQGAETVDDMDALARKVHVKVPREESIAEIPLTEHTSRPRPVSPMSTEY
jgi:hypothetical protein